MVRVSVLDDDLLLGGELVREGNLGFGFGVAVGVRVGVGVGP